MALGWTGESAERTTHRGIVTDHGCDGDSWGRVQRRDRYRYRSRSVRFPVSHTRLALLGGGVAEGNAYLSGTWSGQRLWRALGDGQRPRREEMDHPAQPLDGLQGEERVDGGTAVVVVGPS